MEDGASLFVGLAFPASDGFEGELGKLEIQCLADSFDVVDCEATLIPEPFPKIAPGQSSRFREGLCGHPTLRH